MATGAKKIVRLHGPWKGLNENQGSQSPGDLEAAWNVEIDGDIIRSRRGRRLLSPATMYSRPLKVLVARGTAEDKGSGTYVRGDYTQEATDGSEYTIAPIGSMGGGTGVHRSDAIYLGFSQPVDRINFSLDAPNVEDNGPLIVQYMSAAGWASVADLADTTTVFKFDGSIRFTKPTDWVTGPLSDANGYVDGFPAWTKISCMYWLKIRLTSPTVLTTDDAAFSDISVTDDMNHANDILAGANGMFQWRTPTGERLLIVGKDDKDNGSARLISYNRVQQNWDCFSIPGAAAKSGVDAYWQFQVMPEGLVACNGYTLVFAPSSDPMNFQQFKPVSLVNFATQSNDPPSAAKCVAVFGDRIFVALGNKVMFSQPVGDTYGLASNTVAPLGGCNVFYPTSDFTVVDDAGGQITAMATCGKVLVVFTPRTTWVWDGLSLLCVDQNIGCVAPRSLCRADDSLFFLGPGGPYKFTNGQNVPLGGNIPFTIGEINEYAANNSVGEYYARARQYRLVVPHCSSMLNNICLVYHVGTGGWTLFGVPEFLANTTGALYKEYEVACIHSARDEEWNEELLTLDYHGNLYLEDSGEYDYASNVYPAFFVTGRIKGEDNSLFRVRGVRGTFQTDGARTVRVAILKDGESWQTRDATYMDFNAGRQSTTVNLADKDEAATLTKYGAAALFGTSKWTERKMFQQMVPMNLTARNVRIIVGHGLPGSGSNWFAIKGFDIEYIEKATRRASP